MPGYILFPCYFRGAAVFARGRGAAVDRPGGVDGAEARIVGEVEVAEAGREGGMEGDGVEAGVGGVGVDAGGEAVEPLGDGAVGVVVVGVHGGVRAHGVAVPSLPGGGGAVIDEVAPGGVLAIEEELVGDVGVARVGEDFEEVGRAEEAGAEAHAVGADLRDELLGGGGSEGVRHEMHVER